MKFHGFCIFGVLFALMFIDCGRAESRGPVYGNISGAYLFQDRVTKGKIPLFTRSATFEYPVTHPDDKSKPVYRILRGIEHVNFVDKEETGCGDPNVEIVEGGLYYPNAKIEVTSERGCPLDSVIYFYGSR